MDGKVVEEQALDLHFKAMCYDRQAAAELLMADCAISDEMAAWHLGNRQICQEMAEAARLSAARLMTGLAEQAEQVA